MRHVLTVLALLMLPATAMSLAQDVVLTVRSATGESHSFNMADLDALPQESFQTTTVWTDGVQEFSGPALKTVLDQMNLTGTTITARALNDYAIEIPVESIEQNAPIIATRMNGQEFPRREKGPLWIIYPYDSDERFQTESVFGRSIWQLHELTVE